VYDPPIASVPVLWQYNFSNYNEKARWALDFKRVPHTRRSLLPNMPRAMLFSLRGTLPVLDLDGERIVDSTSIVEALERRYPEPALYPDDPSERRRALELEDFFDEHAGHELRRVAFVELREDPDFASAFLTTGRGPTTRRIYRMLLAAPWSMAYANHRYRLTTEDAATSRVTLAEALDRITAELQPSGYLVGSSFTVADLTAASLLFPLAWPAELQYDYPEPPDSPYMRSFQAHPALEWVREIYRRHRGGSAEIRG
jgi:glutathione S-transferase